MGKKKDEKQKFSYAVGYYRESGSIACYMVYSSEVHFGTLKDAQDYREYCRKQSKKDKDPVDYKIFMLVEVPE